MTILIFSPHHDNIIPDGAIRRSTEITKRLRSLSTCCIEIKRRSITIHKNNIAYFALMLPFLKSKNLAAVKTLIFRSHYLVSKHIDFLNLFFCYFLILWYQPKYIYINFCWAYPFLRPLLKDKKVFIDTHNYDLDWWLNLYKTSTSFLAKKVCLYSLAKTNRIFRKISKSEVFIHTTFRDKKSYKSIFPQNIHLVVANACNVNFRKKIPDYKAKRKRIYFFGSLGAVMSFDALLFFSRHFWPYLNDIAEFFVIGNGVQKPVKDLVQENNWILKTDIPDSKLKGLLTFMHYCVMPFSYSAGSKLKFIEACAMGIPVLTTKQGTKGFRFLPKTVLVSVDPLMWRRKLTSRKSPSKQEVSSCKIFAERYSWDTQFENLSSFLSSDNSE